MYGFKYRLGFHEHARPTSEWIIVYGSMFVYRVVSNIIDINLDFSGFQRSAHYPFGHWAVKQSREKCEDMKFHTSVYYKLINLSACDLTGFFMGFPASDHFQSMR